MTRIYDNWERLVETVLRREKLRQLALEHSRSPTVSSISSSFSFSSSSPLDEMYWRLHTKEKFIEKPFGRLIPVVDSLDFAVGLEDVLGPSSKFIGKGTFGSTYKLAMDNGVVAVVKRLRGVVVPGRVFEEQMKAIGSIRHQNVASLRAYYFSMYEKLIVYDYFGQGSVSTMLQGSRGENSNPLDWETTQRVAIELLTRKSHRYYTDGSQFDLVQWVHYVMSKEQPVVISEEELTKYPNVEDQMVKMLRIGISCLNAIPEHRPKMFEVVNLVLSFKLASNDIETTHTLKDDKPEEKTRNRDTSRDKVSTESHAVHQTFEGAVRRGYVNEIEKY
ncbi:putative inactive receptor kinase [Sesamum angolense]|uniref:Inactive receptor kinase n=1 Tax=Sesamum angolense TaxID=2727404 RepID=A0AAE1X1K6_9LAMI|nr:putative inactive receptor kinase [Sesamum angolense]